MCEDVTVADAEDHAGNSNNSQLHFIGDADVWLRSWYLVMILKMNLIKIYVWTSDMTLSSYFDKMNSTLGSVVPLAMFIQ